MVERLEESRGSRSSTCTVQNMLDVILGILNRRTQWDSRWFRGAVRFPNFQLIVDALRSLKMIAVFSKPISNVLLCTNLKITHFGLE